MTRVALLLVLGFAVLGTSCGDPDQQSDVPTGGPATEGAATAVSRPSPTPALTPSRITPEIVDPAVSGCPEGWAFVDEPAFSFCYPADMVVTHVDVAAGPNYNLQSSASTMGDFTNETFLAIAQQATRGFDPQRGCENVSSTLVNAFDFRAEVVTWANGMQEGCFSSANDGTEQGSYQMDIPTDAGFVSVLVVYGGPDIAKTRSAIEAIVATLVVK